MVSLLYSLQYFKAIRKRNVAIFELKMSLAGIYYFVTAFSPPTACIAHQLYIHLIYPRFRCAGFNTMKTRYQIGYWVWSSISPAMKYKWFNMICFRLVLKSRRNINRCDNYELITTILSSHTVMLNLGTTQNVMLRYWLSVIFAIITSLWWKGLSHKICVYSILTCNMFCCALCQWAKLSRHGRNTTTKVIKRKIMLIYLMHLISSCHFLLPPHTCFPFSPMT